ncbi:MAG: hypothetical protein HYW69_01915 [Candidatus Nealsonbacteria bacterium]|nr:hypothetical protein [Candidatus Nealsonbacteria bacterium]
MRSEVFKYGPTEPKINPGNFDGLLEILESRSSGEILKELDKIVDELLELAVRLEALRARLKMIGKSKKKNKFPWLEGVDKYGTVVPRK